MARYTDSQSICIVIVSFREALFFQLKAPVRFVKRHAKLVRSRGKRVLEIHRLAVLLRRQVCREEEFAIRKHGQGAFTDRGSNFNVKPGTESSRSCGFADERQRGKGGKRRLRRRVRQVPGLLFLSGGML